MKRSEIEKELKELEESSFYMRCNFTGSDWHRAEVSTKIVIYEKLLKEGYEDDSPTATSVPRKL